MRYYDYAHVPSHFIGSEGAYFVTGATYCKQHYFNSNDRRSLLLQTLLNLSNDYGCKLEAWAVFSNHFHFVGRFPGGGSRHS